MTSKRQDKTELAGRMWIIGLKIRGIGHLIKYQNAEPPTPSEVSYGIGEMLLVLCDELDDLKEEIEKTR